MIDPSDNDYEDWREANDRQQQQQGDEAADAGVQYARYEAMMQHAAEIHAAQRAKRAVATVAA